MQYKFSSNDLEKFATEHIAKLLKIEPKDESKYSAKTNWTVVSENGKVTEITLSVELINRYLNVKANN